MSISEPKQPTPTKPTLPAGGSAWPTGRRSWLLVPAVLLLSACASEAAIRASDERFGLAVPRPAPVAAPAAVPGGPGPGSAAPDAAAVAAEGEDVPLMAGRVAYVGGPASIWDVRENAWREAVLNETIGPSSTVRTEPGSRLEVVIGTTALRLDSGSRLSWAALDPQHTEVDLDTGSLIVSLRDEVGQAPAGNGLPAAAPANASANTFGNAAGNAPGSAPGSAPDAADMGDAGAAGQASGMYPVVVIAGAVAVTLDRAGATQLQVDEEGRRLTVHAGADEVLVDHGGVRTTMARGQVLGFDTESGQATTAAAPVNATFAAWSSERDRQTRASQTYRYVSPAMTGAEVLDDYGRWQVDQTYGPIWYPTTVAAGWAPYRYGRWTWVAPWGWTWIDDAPWGYAPFHYGRWAYVGSRWGWVPGDWVARPVYSPALVGYYGGGASVTIVAGAPAGIGWFPLAPWEPWYPAYRYSPRYLAAVNRPWGPSRYSWRGGQQPRGNYLAPPARYRYAEFPRAVTVVPAPRFGAGRTTGARIPVSGDQLRRLPPPSRTSALPAPPRLGQAPPLPGGGADRFRPPLARPVTPGGQPGQAVPPRFGSRPGTMPDRSAGGAPPRSGLPPQDPRGGRYSPPPRVGQDSAPRPMQPLPVPQRQWPSQGYSPPQQRHSPGPQPVVPQQPLPLPSQRPMPAPAQRSMPAPIQRPMPAPPSLQRQLTPPPAAAPRTAPPSFQRHGPAPRYSPPRHQGPGAMRAPMPAGQHPGEPDPGHPMQRIG